MGFLLWLLLLPAMYVFIRYAMPVIANDLANRRANKTANKPKSKGKKKQKTRKSRGFKGLMLIGTGLVGYRLYLVLGLTIVGIILTIVLVVIFRNKIKTVVTKIVTIGTVKVTDVDWNNPTRTEIVWIDGKRYKRKWFNSKDGGEYSIDTYMPVDMENTTKTYDAETNTTKYVDNVTGKVILQYSGSGSPSDPSKVDPNDPNVSLF